MSVPVTKCMCYALPSVTMNCSAQLLLHLQNSLLFGKIEIHSFQIYIIIKMDLAKINVTLHV